MRDFLVGLIYDYIYMPFFFKLLYFRHLSEFSKIYGTFYHPGITDFRRQSLVYYDKNHQMITILNAEIVNYIKNLPSVPKNILLDSDLTAIKPQFINHFNFTNSSVTTVGIGNSYDLNWDFESDPPQSLLPDFDLIISQANLEHLVNPYKHLSDLSCLLSKKGYLIVHTQLPGYPYHRYPVDCCRFFPDWFERAAQKLNLNVKKRFIRNFHLTYCFQKA